MSYSASSAWDNIINVGNIISYADASSKLNEYLRVLFLEGYDSIVIPSRGAMPFFRAAKSAWMVEALSQKSAEARFDHKVDIMMSPIHACTILPFSADPGDGSQNSKGIRSYWSKVLAALVRRDGGDPYLAFYSRLVNNLLGKELSATLPRDLPNKKFIFIDTVVSGRAICEIVECLENEGLEDFYLILLVDENGAKIDSVFRRKIDQYVSYGRCALIEVPSLWTEDQGPAVSGVWSTVYPEIQQKLMNEFSWASNAYGAGTFYHRVSTSQNPVVGSKIPVGWNMPITIVHGTISEAISAVSREIYRLKNMSDEFGGEYPKEMAAYRERSLAGMHDSIKLRIEMMWRFLDEMPGFFPFDKKTTRMLAEPGVNQIFQGAAINVSSSHLVRVTLPRQVVDKVFIDFNGDLANSGLNVLHDSWFR